MTLSRLSYLSPASDQVTGTLNAVTLAQVVALLLTGGVLAAIGVRTLPGPKRQARAAASLPVRHGGRRPRT